MKTKRSMINAIVSLVSTAITSILSLISTNLILKNYGSDFNGLVATAMQIMSILLLFEGGITYASNYALYKPYVENDYKKINGILYKSSKQFLKVGLLVFIFGLLVSFIYPLVIKSDLDYFSIFFIMAFIVIGSSFTIGFTTKMTVLFQAAQKEYVLSIISLIINIISYIFIIVFAILNVNMIIIRVVVLSGTLCNGILIYFVFKKYFPKAKYNNPDSNVKIIGSRDIIIQKITSMIYSSSPMIIMSTIVGTVFTSVYAVYNSIFSIIKTVMYSLVSAPSNGFGQLFQSDKKDQLYEKFSQYEYIVLLILICLLSSVSVVIIPFITLYTSSITDVQYVDYYIAIIFALNVFFEMIHTPSGTIICVSGHFKAARNIQTVACIVLVILLISGGYLFGLYGIMGTLLITSIVLAVLEIWYAHKKIFNKSVKNFIYKICLNFFITLVLCYLWNIMNIRFNSYTSFLISGLIIFITNTLVILLVNCLFFKEDVRDIKSTIKQLFSKK